ERLVLPHRRPGLCLAGRRPVLADRWRDRLRRQSSDDARPGDDLPVRLQRHLPVQLSQRRPISVSTFMGGKPYAILLDASRWPMLEDEPDGFGFTGSLTDPPS